MFICVCVYMYTCVCLCDVVVRFMGVSETGTDRLQTWTLKPLTAQRCFIGSANISFKKGIHTEYSLQPFIWKIIWHFFNFFFFFFNYSGYQEYHAITMVFKTNLWNYLWYFFLSEYKCAREKHDILCPLHPMSLSYHIPLRNLISQVIRWKQSLKTISIKVSVWNTLNLIGVA